MTGEVVDIKDRLPRVVPSQIGTIQKISIHAVEGKPITYELRVHFDPAMVSANQRWLSDKALRGGVAELIAGGMKDPNALTPGAFFRHGVSIRERLRSLAVAQLTGAEDVKDFKLLRYPEGTPEIRATIESFKTPEILANAMDDVGLFPNVMVDPTPARQMMEIWARAARAAVAETRRAGFKVVDALEAAAVCEPAAAKGLLGRLAELLGGGRVPRF